MCITQSYSSKHSAALAQHYRQSKQRRLIRHHRQLHSRDNNSHGTCHSTALYPWCSFHGSALAETRDNQRNLFLKPSSNLIRLRQNILRQENWQNHTPTSSTYFWDLRRRKVWLNAFLSHWSLSRKIRRFSRIHCERDRRTDHCSLYQQRKRKKKYLNLNPCSPITVALVI